MNETWHEGWYRQVLEELDRLSEEVTAWEAEFLDSLLAHPERRLSPKQRAVIEKMQARYLA